MADINAFVMKDQQNYLAEMVDFKPLVASALSGDLVFQVTPATAGASKAALATADTVVNMKVRLVNAAGAVHNWYNGKVTLAIADDDDTGVAAIAPAAGERAMVNGELDVVMTLPTAVWTKNKAATLTVTPPVALILGHTPATKTGVVTIGD